MTCRAYRVMALLLALAPFAASARASEFSDDLKARRARLMERLGPSSFFVAWSAPAARYSRDIDYEYRQDSNLYYLTGITQEDTVLVLMPGNAVRREVLFIRDRNPAQEHRNGRRLTAAEATAISGIDTVLTTNQFDAFSAAILSGRGYGAIDDKEAAPLLTALGAGTARVQLLLDEGRGLNDPLTPALEFSQKIRDRFVGFQVADATPAINGLRVVKTPYERTVLLKSFELSNAAQIAGIRAAHPEAYEYEVRAAIDQACRARGGDTFTYPPIVASGPNANILHYPDGERQMRRGELLLVDAACRYQYMSDDITRTFPLNGTFSPLQKDVYEIVLQAQEAGIKAAANRGSLQDVNKAAVEVIKAGLLKLGLITDASGDQYRLWFTHFVGHYIGLDVHDVGSTSRPLEPGMTFTIEPGLYIRQSALDTMARTEDNVKFIERVQAAVKKYADIGVRIEDSFLIEDTGIRRLSTVPRTVEEVERVLRDGTTK